MKPVVEEFNQLLRWLQPNVSGGRPGLGTNQRGQASSLQCAECAFVSLVIAEIGDSGVWFRFRQNCANGITLSRPGIRISRPPSNSSRESGYSVTSGNQRWRILALISTTSLGVNPLQ